jgi:hypothetical protein
MVFNMAQMTTMGLFTTGGVDIGTTQVVRTGSLGTYLTESAPPPPSDPGAAAAQALQQAENVMWNNVSKSIPGCTRCAELAQQAVQVFW